MSAVRLLPRALGVALAIWSCSVFTDLSGLSGAPSHDGRATMPDGAPGEASASDGPRMDSGAPGCAARSPTPKFCDDFERPAAQLIGAWDGLELTGNGVAALDALDSASPVQSLITSIPQTDAGEAHAYLHRAFPVSPTEIRMELDWKLDAPVTTGEINFAEIGLYYPSGAGLYLKPVVGTNGAFLRESDYRTGQDFHYHPFTRAPIFGQWEHAHIQLTFASPAHVTVRLGADVVVDTDLTSPGVVAPAKFDAKAGIVFNVAPATAFVMHSDNVIVDYP
jgi:hypothetical protein